MPLGNPQLENGYTPIANELLEGIILNNLGSAEFKVLLAVMRMTYGWSRKEAEISTTVFEAMTGMERRHIVRAVKSLLQKGYIERFAGAKMKYGQPVYKYVVNKKSCCQKDTRTIAKRTPEAIAKRTPNKTNKTILNNKRCGFVDKFTMFPATSQ